MKERKGKSSEETGQKQVERTWTAGGNFEGVREQVAGIQLRRNRIYVTRRTRETIERRPSTGSGARLASGRFSNFKAASTRYVKEFTRRGGRGIPENANRSRIVTLDPIRRGCCASRLTGSAVRTISSLISSPDKSITRSSIAQKRTNCKNPATRRGYVRFTVTRKNGGYNFD